MANTNGGDRDSPTNVGGMRHSHFPLTSHLAFLVNTPHAYGAHLRDEDPPRRLLAVGAPDHPWLVRDPPQGAGTLWTDLPPSPHINLARPRVHGAGPNRLPHQSVRLLDVFDLDKGGQAHARVALGETDHAPSCRVVAVMRFSLVGNFFVYREINERASSRSGSKKPYPLDSLGALEARTGMTRATPLPRSPSDHGTFKPNGLIKKTITVTIEGADLHLVSYYTSEDIRSGRLRSIPPHVFQLTNFRVPPKTEIGPDGKPRFVPEPEDAEPNIEPPKVEETIYHLSHSPRTRILRRWLQWDGPRLLVSPQYRPMVFRGERHFKGCFSSTTRLFVDAVADLVTPITSYAEAGEHGRCDVDLLTL
ncbi:hypothetical protein BDZ89DRAFT_1134053 [Hymenopellis radicata]|nr:hypothetical protein BDZ89DRAFT_1134053 [Hymenopellis radicata]